MNIAYVVVEPVTAIQLKVYYQNFLEDATITVTSENTSYPKYRLYDRAQGLLFKGTSHPNPFSILADLGPAGPYPLADSIILGSGHNLTGLGLELYYASVLPTWTLAKAWTATAGINRQTFTGHADRYWILNIIAPAANPEIGEIFLSSEYHFEANPKYDYQYRTQGNANRLLSRSGLAQKTKWGTAKRTRTYNFVCLSDTDRINIEAISAELDSIKNFYFEDFENNLFLAEIIGDLTTLQSENPSIDPGLSKNWIVSIQIGEVLD